MNNIYGLFTNHLIFTFRSPLLNLSNTFYFKTLFCIMVFLGLGHQSMAQTTFTVTNNNTTGAGSFHQAIIDSNNSPGKDIITFDAAYTIEVDGSSLNNAFNEINQDLTINGDIDDDGEADITLTDADNSNTIETLFIDGVGLNVEISGIIFESITSDNDGTAIATGSSDNINLSVSICEFRNLTNTNTNGDTGGAIALNSGNNVTVDRCIFSNVSQSGSGAVIGMNQNSNIVVTNSLFYGNNVGFGLIDSFGSSATIVVRNVTSVDNVGNTVSTGNGSTASVYNTIYDSGTTVSGSNNILESTSLFSDAANNDYTLASGASSAIDQGDDMQSSGSLDLAGNTRVQGASVDIGAYESLAPSNAAPEISTASPTNITGITADLGGNVTDDGGATVTERGVVYSSIDTDPEIGEADVTKDTNGSGTGSFIETITGLSKDTTYYFKAYAVNSEGTSYGGVETFTTLDCDTSFSYSASAYCVDASDPTPTITGLTGGTFSSSAGLVINSTTGEIDLSMSTPGNYTVTYTTGGNCPNSINQNVTINALDDASFSYDQTSYYVEGMDPTPSITGLTGGSFSSSPAGLSLNASTGEIDLSASTTGNYTITYTTSGTCPNSATFSLDIEDLVGETITYNTANGYVPIDPNGKNLLSTNLLVEDGTAQISSTTSLNTVTVEAVAILELNADLTIDDVLLFESNASSTGQLADATGVSISGNVTVERFIPVATEDTRAFRFLTSAVDSNEPIFNNWQEGGNSPAGFGTHITGNNDGTNGVDQTATGNPSMYTFDNQNTNGGGQDDDWQAITDTKANDLVAGKAYRTFIRGDRNYNLNAVPGDTDFGPNSDVTLRATGSLALGDQSYNLNPNEDEFSLVGNPYQAIVDMSLVTSNNINSNFYYVWDPNINGNNGRGGYITVDVGNSTSTGTSNANKFVMPGQSFFVQTLNNGTADITFSETDKAVNESSTTVFSDDGPFKLDLLLYQASSYNDGGSEADALTINFQAGGNNAVDQLDADKIANPGENLSRVNANSYLSIENRAIPVDDETLELYSEGLSAMNYILVAELANLPSDVSPYLIDDHTGEQTLLNEGENQISFTADPSSPGSVATDRFSIEFEIETFGVEDNEAADNFKVYPNPVENDQVTIQAPNMSGEVDISLSNILGQRVISTKGELSGNGEMTLNIGDQQSGVYFIELSQNGQTAKERLIIK